VVTKARQWERTSGATFEADKTTFIHFPRTAARRSDAALIVKKEEIRPRTEIKILGVILDQALRYKLHVARASKRGTRIALALKRIKGLRPKTAK